VTLRMSNWHSTSFHIRCSVSLVTWSVASLILTFILFRSQILSILTQFFTYPQKTSSNLNLGLLSGHRITPPLPIHLPWNITLRTSMTRPDKCSSVMSCWIIMVAACETVWVKECRGITQCDAFCVFGDRASQHPTIIFWLECIVRNDKFCVFSQQTSLDYNTFRASSSSLAFLQSSRDFFLGSSSSNWLLFRSTSETGTLRAVAMVDSCNIIF
jgi:hypothetical protein